MRYVLKLLRAAIRVRIRPMKNCSANHLQTIISIDQHFTGGKTQRSDMLKWEKVGLQSMFWVDTDSSTLISNLIKSKWQHRDFQHIRRWCKALTNLFYEMDEDESGSIE